MTSLRTNYPKFIMRHFHIHTPMFGVWKKHGWEQGTWALGLNKKRIDQLAEAKMTAVVSYNITQDEKSDEYTIKAEKVKEFPVAECKDGTLTYAVPLFALNKRKK